MTAALAAVAAYAGTTGGGSPPPASISLSDCSIFNASYGAVTVSYQIANDGTVVISDEGGLVVFESWLQGSGGAVSGYEVYASQVSGAAITSGSLGTWLSCSTSRTWSLTNSASNNSTQTAVLTISIRDVATHTVQDSATVTLQAESDHS